MEKLIALLLLALLVLPVLAGVAHMRRLPRNSFFKDEGPDDPRNPRS